MTEIFGAVAGALSVVALFNNVVDTFGYIQLGRNFKRDYALCQLKLDVARNRLSRWGVSVNIHENPQFLAESPTDEGTRTIQSLLENIQVLFRDVYHASKRYEQAPTTGGEELTPCVPERDLNKPVQKLRSKFSSIASRRRSKGLSFLDKTYWAIYDAKNFEVLIAQLTDFIGSLEALSRVELGPVQRHLVEIEVEEIGGSDDKADEGNTESLKMLQSATSTTDEALHKVVEQKIEAQLNSHNRIGNLKATENARTMVGDHWTMEAMRLGGGGVGSRSVVVKHEVESADMAGSSRLQVGSTYGGGSIWD